MKINKILICLILIVSILVACTNGSDFVSNNRTPSLTEKEETLITTISEETATVSEEKSSASKTTEKNETAVSSQTTVSEKTKTTKPVSTRRTTTEATEKNTTKALVTEKETTVKLTTKISTTKPKVTKPSTTKVSTTAEDISRSTTQTETTTAQENNYCTVRIECKTIFSNLDKFKENKKAFLPSGGVILNNAKVQLKGGESAFDVIKKACGENSCSDNCQYCRQSGIQLEYTYTPAFNNYYIEGIHQIYEKDCGSQSGWMFSVNGVFLDVGSSSYFVSPGDIVVFSYTCNMGEDIGNHY